MYKQTTNTISNKVQAVILIVLLFCCKISVSYADAQTINPGSGEMQALTESEDVMPENGETIHPEGTPPEEVIPPGEVVPPENITSPENTVPPSQGATTPPTGENPGVGNQNGETSVIPSVSNPIVGENTNQNSFVTETRLSSLKVSEGNLYPSFSQDVYQYVLYLEKPNKAKKLIIEYEPMDPMVSVLIAGNLEYFDENSTVTVQVNGSQNKKTLYNIDLIIIKHNELLVDGTKLYVAHEDIDLDLLPLGFSKSNKEFKGGELVVAESADGKLFLARYFNTGNINESKWYTLNLKDGEATEANFIEIDNKKYLVVDDKKCIVYGDSGEGIGYYIYDADKDELREYISNTLEEKVFFINPIIIIVMVVLVLSIALAVIIRKRINKKINSTETINDYFVAHLSFDDEE